MATTLAPTELLDTPLAIGGRGFRSRLMVGTGKYRHNQEMAQAIDASGAEIVTVAVRRVDLDRTKEEGVLHHLSPERYFLLANTAGCYTADEAVRYARLAREAGFNEFVKLEVIGDRETLLPDTAGLLEAARVLVKDGFTVLAYTSDDLITALRLEDAGCAAVMPLASPIGSGLGLLNPYSIRTIKQRLEVPVIVDAGVGTASDACLTMEQGVDGILMNTALAANDPDYSPDVEDVEGTIQEAIQQIFARCSTMIAERRENPTEDLTSVLVHAEVDGEQIEEHEIVMGFFLLVAAGNDSTRSTYSSAMRALMESPDQRQLLVDDPSLIPGAVEEALRMFPAFAHFRRTTTKDTVLNGQKIKKGEKVVMWYPSSNRDESCYEDPDRFDVRRNPDHQAFGAGGRHFCLGASLARLELKILLEETLARYPNMTLAGKPTWVESAFLNQLKTLPVRLSP